MFWSRGIVVMITSAVALLFVAGCISPAKGSASSNKGPRRSQARLNKEGGEHGLQMRTVVDAQGNKKRIWIYVPRGIPKTMTEAVEALDPEKVLEMAEKTKDTDHKTALFGAQWVSQTYANSSLWAPRAMILEAEVLEAQRLYNYAYDAYQKLNTRWPEHPRRHEVMERQIKLADRFMAGQRFKWRLPFQQSIYLPMPRWLTRGRTAKLYNDIVENAPYGPLAAEAQFKEGVAYHKDLDTLGVLGMFVTQRQTYKDIDQTVGAYQMTADRYGRREMMGLGLNERIITAEEKVDRVFKALDEDEDAKLTRKQNPGVFNWQGFSSKELEDDIITSKEMLASLRRQETMVARARFNIGQVYEDQASDGLYDQTMAGKAQDAYGVFLNYYAELTGQSQYGPRSGFNTEWFQEHVFEAQKRIDLMRLEQAHGFLSIAEFYVNKGDWVAAEKYYSKVVAVVLFVSQSDLIERRKAMVDQANEGSRLMRTQSITSGVQAYEAARAAEASHQYDVALRLYRRADVALNVNAGDIEGFGESEKIKKAARKYNKRSSEDVRRMEAVRDRVRMVPPASE